MPENIRVNDLCEGFKNLKFEGIPPEPLKSQFKVLCKAAGKGNPAVLETNEAEAVDKTSGDIYSEYGGVYEFAKVMTNTALANPVSSSFWDNFSLAKLYEGFLEIPVSEPPFMVGKFKIDKVAENMETGVQTLLVNGDVLMDITPEKAAFRFEVPAWDFDRYPGSKNLNFDFANYLPFMPGYGAEDFRKTQNARLEEPVGETYFVGTGIEHPFFDEVYTRSVYVDERGLFFYDKGKAESFGDMRAYLSTPTVERGSSSHRVNEIKLSNNQVVTYDAYITEKRRREAEEAKWRSEIGSCFTGDMNLETDGGNRITFDELYDVYRSGAELPYVRVWNPEENRWTYQQPERVLRHLLPYSAKIQSIQTSNGQLKVTPNHFLWARRGEDEFWLRAGEIKEGDYLLTNAEGNGEKVWREVERNITMDKHGYLMAMGRANETTLEVFNLTFGKGIGLYFNYAVCGDYPGSECAVAHNGMK